MGSLTGVDAPIMAFDASHLNLAIASSDGRVKLFSVAQQRLTADLTQDLAGKGASLGSEIYTCIAWGATGPSQRLLFVGTTSGQVKCYDVARAKLRWSAPGGVDGSLAALACSPDGAGGVLVLASGGEAAVLSPDSGAVLSQWRASKHRLFRGAMLPGGGALVAGSSVALHDAASGARLHKWTGHAAPVVALAATADGQYCCTAGEGERAVAVWSLAAGKSGKLKHKSAVAQLNLDQPAAHVSVAAVPGGGGAAPGTFQVAAVTQSGALRLFECTPGEDGRVVARQWGASSGAGASSVLLAGVDSADAGGVNLLLAAGSAALPSFQRVRADKAPDGAAASVPVEAPDTGALVGAAQAGAAPAIAAKAAAGATGVAVLGAAEGTALGARFGKRAAADAGLDEASGLPGEAMDEDAAVGSDSDSGAEGDGPTMGERVAALQEASIAAASGGGTVSSSAAADAFPSGPIKADSLAVLLTQALRSGDRALLERCLSVRNDDVVNNTVRRLAPADAAAFLRAAVARLQSSPARGEQLAAWVRAVLLHHAAFLAGSGGGAGTLGHLYQLIEARLASYQPLLALSGRLDLVLAHSKKAGAEAGGGGGGANGPLVTLQVGPGGEVEVEDAFAAAGLDSDEDEEGEGYSEEDSEEGDAEDFDSEEEDA